MDRRSFLGTALVASLHGPRPAAAADGPGKAPASPMDLIEGWGSRDTRILHGPPGSGKTTLALQAALTICEERAQHVIFVRGPETFEELVGRAGPEDATRFFDFSCNDGGSRMDASRSLMSEPRVWIEDPRWLLETTTPPFFGCWLERHSPIPCGLVVIDALAMWPREMHGRQYPAASEDLLVPHQVGALEQKVPRLVIIDSGVGESVRLVSFSSGWVPSTGLTGTGAGI